MKALLKSHSLTIKTVSQKQESELISNISFEIYSGEIVGVTGPSGSGKSLTGQAMIGLISSIENLTIHGEIIFLGKVVSSYNDNEWSKIRGKDISLISQSPISSFNPVRKCIVQLEEALKIHNNGINDLNLKLRIQNLLREVQLDEFPNIYTAFPHELSGGQLQRLAIAMAMANNPKLIIADEPTSSLDFETSQVIQDLLVRLCRENNMALFLISHDLEFLKKTVQRLIFIKGGKIMDDVKIADLSIGNYSYELKCYLDYNIQERNSKLRVEENQELLRLENIYAGYRKTVGVFSKPEIDPIIHDVSFSLHKSEILGIQGESGSGKSTLARVIAGILPVQSGRLFFNGNEYSADDLDTNHSLRMKIQLLLQNASTSLQPEMTIGEQWNEVIKVADRVESKEEIIDFWLENTGLTPTELKKYPNQLSGGQQQRAALARTLIVEPELIIFDETLSALDIYHQNKIVDLIISLQEKLKFSAVFISHDLKLIKSICHKMIVVKEGRVVANERFF